MRIPRALFLCGIAAIAFGCASSPEQSSKAGATTPQREMRAVLLTDFSDDLPRDDRNVTLSLWLKDIRPMPNGLMGNIAVQLQRRDGQWAADAEHYAAADYNQRSSNIVKLQGMRFDGERLTGTMLVTINADRPRPNPTRGAGPLPFPATRQWSEKWKNWLPHPDTFVIRIDARRQLNEPMPHLEDTEPSNPPWRNDTPTFGGEILNGSYEAVREGKTFAGQLIGAVAPAPTPGVFGTEGNCVIEPAPRGHGMEVLARLPRRRVAAKYSAHAVKPFTTPRDWSDFKAVRITVESKRRRDDAAVRFAFRQGTRGWVGLTSAALLLGREATFTIPFEHFGPSAERRDDVQAIQIGVASPHGVGDVAFTVRKIELLRPKGGRPLFDTTKRVAISVDPDNAVSLNGADTIPKGLFGHHDVYHNMPRDPRTGEPDPFEYMRLINPGYLRPLDHVGFGTGVHMPSEAFLRRAEAGNALDNIVWCHTVDLFARPAWMDEGVEKWEKKVAQFYEALAKVSWKPGDERNPFRRFEVWNEPFFWGRHINIGAQLPEGRKPWDDPTQYGYVPGKLGATVYARFFDAAVDAAKKTNPHVQLGGPSAPAFSGDDFGVFENYVRHWIDACHDKIDFLTEHHYGGNPQSPAASYDVATAYCDINYGKRYPIYNTETNDLGGSSAAKAQYNIVDILTCIQDCPDIARGRAIHALWRGYLNDEGEYHAMRLLSPLRGKILRTTSSDEDVLVVAGAPGDGKMVVLVFNNAGDDRAIDMPMPKGFSLEQTMLLIADVPKDELRVNDIEGQPIPAPAAGKTVLREVDTDDAATTLTLPPRSAVRWTFTMDGYRPGGVIRIDQHYVNRAFVDVTPKGDVIGKVLWRGGAFDNIRKAWLRVVTRDVHAGEGAVVINGRWYELPFSSSNFGDAVVQEVEIDAALLKPETLVEFHCADPENQNGYKVFAASVLVER